MPPAPWWRYLRGLQCGLVVRACSDYTPLSQAAETAAADDEASRGAGAGVEAEAEAEAEDPGLLRRLLSYRAEAPAAAKPEEASRAGWQNSTSMFGLPYTRYASLRPGRNPEELQGGNWYAKAE